MKTMKKMMTLLAVVGLVLALAPAASQASTIYYESFTESAYPTAFLGSTPDSGGGVWTIKQNTSADQIVTGSIVTTGTEALTATGGKLDLDYGSDTRTRSTLTAGLGDDGTTKYASFLIDITNPGAVAGGFDGLEFHDSGGLTFRIGWLGGDYGVHGATVDTGSGVMSAGLNFVVAEFNFGAGNNDTVDLYFNPTAGELAAGTFSAQLATADYSFDIFEIVQYNDGLMNGYIDEIRVGDELSDVAVVPEPATMSLLAIGGLGVLLKRRRRRA